MCCLPYSKLISATFRWPCLACCMRMSTGVLLGIRVLWIKSRYASGWSANDSTSAQQALHGTSENIPTQRVDSRSRRACDCLIRDGRPLASALALSSALRARSIMPAIQHHKVCQKALQVHTTFNSAPSVAASYSSSSCSSIVRRLRAHFAATEDKA